MAYIVLSYEFVSKFIYQFPKNHQNVLIGEIDRLTFFKEILLKNNL